MNYDGLRQMIQSFVADSQPSCLNEAAPCTVGDMKQMEENLARVLDAFVDEMQSEFEEETVPDD